MVSGPIPEALRHLRRLADDAADEQLLALFIGGGSDAAFEAIVRRHGPAVARLCRQLLVDPHDAEDAFQATP